MRIRSIEKADREFFIDRCHAFYRTPACDHEIPQQNAERTFELLMHGTPYADCLIAEDDDGTPCAYCLLALTWSNEAGGLCVWLEELMVDDEQRGKGIGCAASHLHLHIKNYQNTIALYTMLGFEGLPYRQMILDTPPLD